MLIIGQTGTVEDIAVRTAKRLGETFATGYGLLVSKTKGQVTASNKTLANRISQRLRRLGVKATRTLQVSGVDTPAGRGGLHKEQRVRFNAMQKLAYRLRTLKKVGACVRILLKERFQGHRHASEHIAPAQEYDGDRPSG